MIRAILLIPILTVMLSCGLTTQPDEPAPLPDPTVTSSGQPDLLVPSTGGLPPPPVAVSKPLSPHVGDPLIEEKIIENHVIVKATMTSFLSGVATVTDSFYVGTDNRYSPVLKFNLDVDEYLKGTGPSSITAVWVDGHSYETKEVADIWLATVLARRDDRWDDREAVFFLYQRVSGFGTVLKELLQRSDHFLLAYGDPYSSDNRYSLHSEAYKGWLPTVGATSTDDDTQEFLQDVPPTSNTITLGEIRERIEAVTTELSADSSKEYQECVLQKYRDMRNERNFPEVMGRAYTLWNLTPSIESGQPAGTEIDRRVFMNPYPDPPPTWLEGTDSSLFGVTTGTSTTEGFEEAEIVNITRPLPPGEYSFDIKESWPFDRPCNYVTSNEVRVTVTSSSGALHSFFFDPVTVGSAVAADGTNGVLKPTSFTDRDGTPATVESISYESGRVRVKVVPWGALSGVLDVIELDGTVSTSLRVSNSAVDVGSNTFTWSVSSQPWEDGDRLMVRIRRAASFAPAPHSLSATTMGSDSIGLSWESVSGVTGHVVEQRVSGVARWESVDTDVKEKSHTVSGLWCGTSYEFRVSAHGDGTQYETVPGPGVSHHATVSETTDAGSAQESPAFANAAYSFSIVEDAPVGSTVGAVSATDPQDDTVTYSITSGNEGERFAIDGSTGRITLAGTLDHDTASSHTLTAQAADGSGGRGTATVTVTVELASCAGGTAVPSPAGNPGLVRDCLALLSARDALEGTVTLNWSDDVAIGKWQGVGVAGTPGRVRSLSLSGLEMDGTLPSALGQLSALESLWMEENRLTGNIPPELGGLRLLKRLSLDDNLLTGPIPESLGRLTYLHTLALADNDLSGSIPVGLGGLGQLRYLSLGGNALTGSVPSQLGSLGSLQNLYLGQNALTGGIPSELGGLGKLEVLYLHGNGLTGAIPTELGGLSRLEELALRQNALTGSVPPELEGLSKLVYLTLSGNNLTGCVPPGLRSISDHDLDRLGLAYCEA